MDELLKIVTDKLIERSKIERFFAASARRNQEIADQLLNMKPGLKELKMHSELTRLNMEVALYMSDEMRTIIDKFSKHNEIEGDEELKKIEISFIDQ